jgi:hypothetical protein
MQIVCRFLIVVAVLLAQSCASLQGAGKSAGAAGAKIAADCAKETIAQQVPELLPKVNQILVSDSMNEAAKTAAIDALKVSSEELRACAMRRALEDLTSVIVMGSRSMEAESMEATARGYIQSRGFEYADGFSPQ